MENSGFDEQMNRIRFATKTRTQSELAELLGISQSSVSEAKKRGNIPADWLLTMLRVQGINPEWILTGEGRVHIGGLLKDEDYHDNLGYQEQATKRMLALLPSRVLADELIRRVETAQVQLMALKKD